jgi:hypothetical protein
MLAAETGKLLFNGAGKFVIEIVDLADGWHIESAENVEQRRFAAPRRAEQDHELARVKVQLDAAQSLHVDFADAVRVGNAVHMKHGGLRWFFRRHEFAWLLVR